VSKATRYRSPPNPAMPVSRQRPRVRTPSRTPLRPRSWIASGASSRASGRPAPSLANRRVGRSRLCIRYLRNLQSISSGLAARNAPIHDTSTCPEGVELPALPPARPCEKRYRIAENPLRPAKPKSKLRLASLSILFLLGAILVFEGCAGVSSNNTIDTTPPSVPSALTANATSATQINLSWTASTDNVGVTGYRIERGSGAGYTTFSPQPAPPPIRTPP
jgi:hypothetical protein